MVPRPASCGKHNSKVAPRVPFGWCTYPEWSLPRERGQWIWWNTTLLLGFHYMQKVKDFAAVIKIPNQLTLSKREIILDGSDLIRWALSKRHYRWEMEEDSWEWWRCSLWRSKLPHYRKGREAGSGGKPLRCEGCHPTSARHWILRITGEAGRGT